VVPVLVLHPAAEEEAKKTVMVQQWEWHADTKTLHDFFQQNSCVTESGRYTNVS
jgi:hypothetical protein